MTDLKNPKLIYLKGFSFLFIGLLSSALLILEHPTIKVAFLLAVAVWAFARLYYFMFYVIEHYVDPGFRFSGLWSFARYLWSKRVPAGDPTRSGHETPSRDKAAPGGCG